MTRDAKYTYSAEDRTGPAVASVKRGLQSVAEVAAIAGFNLAAVGGSMTLAGLGALLKRINDNVDALNDIKDATGSSIENISALEDVAMRGGHAFDVVGQSLVKFNQALGTTIKPGTDAEQVLTRIGLSAKQLRAMDPSEALRLTAMALNQFADDGAKARAVQELFGKSLKEVAPFLKDLAEQGVLNAKVTTQQAEEAEKFNKQLFAMNATLKDVGRTIANPVVTHMNEMITTFKEARERGDEFWLVAERIMRLNPASLGGDVGKWLGNKLGTRSERTTADEIRDLDRLLASDPTLSESERMAMTQRRITLNRQQMGKINASSASLEEAFWGGSQAKPTMGDQKDQAGLKKAAADAAKELADQKKLMLELAGLTPSFTEDWDRLNLMFRNGALSLGQLTMEQEKLLAKQPAIKSEREADIKVMQAWNEAVMQGREEHAAAAVAASQAWYQTRRTLNERTSVLAEQNELLALEAQLMGATTAEREVALNDLRVEQQLKRDLWEITNNLALTEQQRADAVAQATANAQGEKALGRIRAEMAAHQEFWGSIENTAHEAWTNIERDGVGSLKRVGQTLKSAVWDMLYQLTAKQWLIRLSATGGGAADTLASAGNSFATGSMMMRTGASLWGGSSLTNAFGTTAANVTGTGLDGFLATNAAFGTGGSTALSSIMSVAPYAAAALAAISLLKNIGKGETRAGADLGYWHGAGARETFLQSGGSPMGAAATSALGSTAASINAMLAGLGVGGTVAEMHGGYASSDKGRGGVYSGGNLAIGGRLLQFGEVGGRGVDSYESTSARSLSAEEAAKNFGADLLQAQIQALQVVADELPAVVRDMVQGIDAEALTDARAQEIVASIAAVTDSVQAFRAAVGSLPFDWLRDRTVDWITSAAKGAGSMDALLAGQAAFYEFTMTGEQKRLNVARQIAEIVNAAGGSTSSDQVLGTSAAAFRDWVQQISGDAGLYGAAMKVAPAFASLTTSMEDMARAAQEAAEAEAEAMAARVQQRAERFGAYEDLYLTPEEQRQRTARSIMTRVNGAGGALTMSDVLGASREQFRREVERAFAEGNGVMLDALLEVAPAFHALAGEGTTLTSSMDIVSSSLSVYNDVLDRQATTLDQVVRSQSAYVDSMRGLIRELTVGEGAGLTGEARFQAAKGEFLRISSMPVGAETRLQDLPAAVREFMAASQAHYGSSGFQHALNRSMAVGALDASQGAAQTTLTVAQAQLNVLELQLTALQSIRTLADAGNIAEQTYAQQQLVATAQAAGWSAEQINAVLNATSAQSIAAGMGFSMTQVNALGALGALTGSGQMALIAATGAAAGLSSAQIAAAIASANAQAMNNTHSLATWQVSTDHLLAGAIIGASASNAQTVAQAVAAMGGQISTRLLELTAVAQADPSSPWSVGSTAPGLPAGVPLGDGWIRDPSFGAINARERLQGFFGLSDREGAARFLKHYGLTQADAAALIGGNLDVGYVTNWMAQAGIPAFDVGTNLVPRDMLARVHKHEAIVPAAFNPWAPGAGAGGWRAGTPSVDTSGLEAKVERLEAQLVHLTAAHNAAAEQSRVLLARIADGVQGTKALAEREANRPRERVVG